MHRIERGVRLHMFHYSPWRKLQVWGYAAASGGCGLKGCCASGSTLGLDGIAGGFVALNGAAAV